MNEDRDPRAQAESSGSGFRTIFDGFEGYQVPSNDEADLALRSGVVVVDTNALLNLYRYTERTRDDLFRVLESLGTRLWVPHQVMLEFWRNRLSAIGNPGTAAAQAKELLGRSQRSAVDAITQWSKQVALDDDRRVELHERIGALFASLVEVIDDGAPGQVDALTGTGNDPILARLSQILEGKVGAPIDDASWQEAVTEGRRRADELEPPGYLDADKADSRLPEGPAGDYLVWVQLMAEGARRKEDVVLVTGDEKEDWWWRHRSNFLGPRPELVAEYLKVSGRRLFMMAPRDLLARSAVLNVTVAKESVEDVARIRPEPGERPTWNAEGVAELLRRLESEGRVQAEIIRAAALNGGRVDRDTVYEIGQYDDYRMLRGFTRPTARITSELQYEGLVADGVEAMLVPIYKGVKAAFFRVPPEVVEILRDEEPS
jgi:PIN like domain